MLLNNGYGVKDKLLLVMTQEEKNLLIKDLSSRVPYGVKVHAKYTDLGETIEVDGIVKMIDADDGFVGIEVMYDISSSYICVDIDDVKPYLFPLSAMTEEQDKEFALLQTSPGQEGFLYVWNCATMMQWLIKNNFDYNGLIPKGLAKDISELKVKSKLRTSLKNNPKITIGTKIRSKTNPNIILSIISDDCHGDEFECSNGSVLSLKQIEKYYDII